MHTLICSYWHASLLVSVMVFTVSLVLFILFNLLNRTVAASNSGRGFMSCSCRDLGGMGGREDGISCVLFNVWGRGVPCHSLNHLQNGWRGHIQFEELVNLKRNRREHLLAQCMNCVPQFTPTLVTHVHTESFQTHHLKDILTNVDTAQLCQFKQLFYAVNEKEKGEGQRPRSAHVASQCLPTRIHLLQNTASKA